jgi:hypothetical protein
MMYRFRNTIVAFFSFAVCVYLLPLAFARAENMSSSTYRLIFGNFNMTSGTKTSSSYNVTDTVGQTAAGQFGLANNVVKSGFQYIFPIETFTFKISPLSIDFGTLTLGSFSTANQFLEVTTIGAGGYTVKVSEDHALKQTNGAATIPDTSCDSSCTHTTATTWATVTNVGFGYTVTGDDVIADFVGGTKYKQFASLAEAEFPQTIMSSASVGTRRHGVLTYRVSINSLQQNGNYSTQITYMAIPGY